MNQGINTRELVLQMLLEINENGQYSHLVLRQVLDKYQYLSHQERAFMTRLTQSTLEHLLELDYLIDSFSKTKVKKMKPLIRNLLRMSACQLKYMDAIPDSAVCNEAVKLAKKHGFGQLSGFVNGVLRNMARNMETVVWPDPDTDPIRAMEIRSSMPRWILEKWIREQGEAGCRTILEALGREYPLTIRTNLSRLSPRELQEKLAAEGVCAEKTPELDYAFTITGFDYLNSLESFREGDFYVQDISSMMVAEAAAPAMGDSIIDVCAAPGGKSTHLAEKMQGSGMVEARDLTEYKTELIRENIARHGLNNMKAVRMDATVFDPASADRADILICDLPCSGLGVLGRKTDIRYKTRPEDCRELAALQRQILDTVHTYVKPGGRMIYSTCTISREENEDNVSWFIQKYPEFELESQRQILPGEMGQDGFYLAALHRKEGKKA